MSYVVLCNVRDVHYMRQFTRILIQVDSGMNRPVLTLMCKFNGPFVGTCIITYWEHGTWLGAVRCPVCRQQVIISINYFSFSEKKLHNDSFIIL